MKKKINLLFGIFLFMILNIPIGVYGKEVVTITRHGSGYASVLYDDNTALVAYKDYNKSKHYQLSDIKAYLRNINHVYEYLGIDSKNNLYVERMDYKSRTILLSNVKRFVEEFPNFSYSSGVFVETYDNKLYLIKDYDGNLSSKESIYLANGKYAYLMEDSVKEIKYYVNGTIFYTIDNTDDLYTIGENIVGNKINNGKYLYERTLVLENVKKMDTNLILTNNNELYLVSSTFARPILIKSDVEDFLNKSGSLFYMKDTVGKTYRFYVYVDGSEYIRKLEEIDTNDIYQYDDTKTKTYYPSSDSFGYYVYPYLFNEGNVYYGGQLIMSDVVYFDTSFVLTSNGNLYIIGSNDYSLEFSHMSSQVYDELQLIDRNVSEIYGDATGTYESSLIYEKNDNSLWGFGSIYHAEVLGLLEPNIGGGYHLPFCILGECNNEVILENLNINNVLVNQQLDFYVNAYPTNSEKLDITWKSSDESIAKVDATGYITTLKPGKVTITVTLNEHVSDSVELNVMDDSNVFEFPYAEDLKMNIGYQSIIFNDNLGDYDNEFEVTYSDGISNVSVTDENTIKFFARQVGKQSITMTTKNGKYSKTVEFEVYRDISDMKVEDLENPRATGEELKPKVEIEGLVEGVDFTVEYENNILAGRYGSAIITGIGYYYGTITKKFYISYKGYFSDLTFPKIAEQSYTGKQITPKIDIEGLIEGVDYSVSYGENINIGWGFVYITGLTYSGKKELHFYINAIDIEYEVNDYEIYYDGLEHSIDLDIKTDGVKIQYAVYDDDYSETKPVFKDPGTYTVKYILSKNNYNSVSGESTFTIKELMNIEYNLDYDNYVSYDGKEHTIKLDIKTPGVTVKYKDEDGNYTLDEVPKFIKPGTYEIHYQLTKENYYTIEERAIIYIDSLYIDYSANNYWGTYDEKEHFADVQVNTPGVTIKYRDESGNYSLDEPPKYIYPGKYEVYVQLSKENYYTTEAMLIVDIELRGFGYGYSGYIGMYDGKGHGVEIDITKDYPDATVLFADENGDYVLTESPKYTEIGQYKIKFSVSSLSYYKTSYSETDIIIMGVKDEYKKDYKIVGKEYLVVNNPNTYLNDLKSVFNFFDLKVNYLINYYDEYNGILKTNDQLILKDDPLMYLHDKSYTVSVLGEVTGDGKINYLDYVNVYNHIYKSKHPESNKKLLSGAYLISADMSDDGKINYLDYVKIYNKIKELKGGSN